MAAAGATETVAESVAEAAAPLAAEWVTNPLVAAAEAAVAATAIQIQSDVCVFWALSRHVLRVGIKSML